MTIGSSQQLGDSQTNKASPYGLTWLSRKLYRSNVSQIRLLLPGGEALAIGVPHYEQTTPTLEIKSPARVIRHARGGIIGWAESYIDGHWQTPDLRQLVSWAMRNEEALEKAFKPSWFSRKLNRLLHRLNNNSKRGSRRNIAAHYDLGNDFYRHWLDDTMTYSSAIFSTEEQSLEDAQNNKNQTLLNMLELEPEHSVLEVGCGWGGFSRVLNDAGQHPYLGVTLSREQLQYAKDHAPADADQQFKLLDYRDLKGSYDRIVSIEMFEAVGESHWNSYFKKIRDSLKPGGVAVIQVITIEDERFASYRKNVDFIQRYIFPGGMLPSHSVLQEKIFQADLKLEKSIAFGPDYARTLQHWHQRFNQRWQEINQGKFDSAFRNMWNFYLAYCEAGFNSGSTDVRLYKIRRS
ncbi:SAM-dependent methyltransferase [Endozoicomonas sp. OPT23]|uniref:SAM-dependent methyltransferase n=1 Tax=Endozoicomonas sp. OPT23 TaxID=2072845 RepID=UPI00129A6542|nr:cyclopropane-fatty-acyl-phospholipid synthase family protein [Endozoicomonas sp. OPT23]MRI31851.1 SAM-dependent methyltransferase [Endozoicomonas sp. OPT23]